MFENELGQPVLPGFEQEFDFKARKGKPRENQFRAEGQISSLSDEWYTHPEVVELTRTLFGGEIDLDPMSCDLANEIVQAKIYYTAEIDGLSRPWFGNILWNPPWGGSGDNSPKKRGIKKLLDAFNAGDVKNAICVLNIGALTTSWFAPLLNFPVCIPPKRINHWGPDGKGGAPNSGTVLVYVGVNVDRFAQVFGSYGHIMVPYRGGIA